MVANLSRENALLRVALEETKADPSFDYRRSMLEHLLETGEVTHEEVEALLDD